MPPQCLFCDQPAGSREHLWGAWIHRRKNFGPLKISIAGSPEKIINNPEQKISTVCRKCNNGWMSDLLALGSSVSQQERPQKYLLNSGGQFIWMMLRLTPEKSKLAIFQFRLYPSHDPVCSMEGDYRVIKVSWLSIQIKATANQNES
jgi:hypothetical protein